ncbi:hypothetical protein LFL97_22555 [Burkholderia sp. JSH-S8]|nr:hypothetical protein LFL97_22555 [Burkholderia sp. JSH-S8]
MTSIKPVENIRAITPKNAVETETESIRITDFQQVRRASSTSVADVNSDGIGAMPHHA